MEARAILVAEVVLSKGLASKRRQEDSAPFPIYKPGFRLSGLQIQGIMKRFTAAQSRITLNNSTEVADKKDISR